MKSKAKRKLGFRFVCVFLLVFAMLVTSLPAFAIDAKPIPFNGIEDVEIAENSQFNLLENVSAKDENGLLEVAVTKVTCETDDSFVYDNSGVLQVGTAGSVYHVEYTAASPEDESVRYTASRKITSIEREKTTQNENEEFDEDMPFTISELEGMGYKVEMEGAEIPLKHFKVECLNEKPGEKPCEDLQFLADIEHIEGGKLKDHAPDYTANKSDKLHSYVKAHVGEVPIYYIGKLHIENGETAEEKDYIYYTTDKEITNKTVYAVLKEHENERITLTYSHDSDYKVEYQTFEKGTHEEKGPDGWGYDDIFGEDRAISVRKGQDISVNVNIPRGYIAKITAVQTGHHIEHEETIGEMMKYEVDKNDKNVIELTKDSPSGMKHNTSFTVKNIQSDIVITVEYEKVNELKFNAYMWTQTVYAKNRMKIHGNQEPTESNSNLTTKTNSFTWEWDGITSGTHTWELDQLEINGEALIIPMVSLNDVGKSITEKTTLSTGTEVTLTVTSKGGQNAVDGKRHYRLQVDNCYEDITISGGNMVAHRHQEYAIRELFGVTDAGFYAFNETPGIKKDSWQEMKQDTLIGKIGEGDNEWTDPLRFKRRVGFYKPEISFTTKEGEVLQKNSEVGLDPDNDKVKYIEYLIRTDDKTTDKYTEGEYKVVSFDAWRASSDGYFYFRGSEEVKEYVGKKYTDPGWNVNEAYKGVILINIKAYPIRIGLDYQNGGDDSGKNAPKSQDIANLPETQYGGKNGYNLKNNQRLLVSNIMPVDKSNEFVFDHWEVMETNRGRTEEQFWGYLTGDVKKDADGNAYITRPGSEYFIDDAMLDTLENCFYMKADPDSGHTNGNPLNDIPHKGAQTHAILTLRAVWRKRDSKPTIPYTVKYKIAEVKDGKIDTDTEKVIEERTHTVNKGAMLVTDLYQDGNKTPSASIQAVLGGENNKKEDYTKGGTVQWAVYEPKTTKKIEYVDEDNNIATIYLIKRNTKVNVEKVWASGNHIENDVKVQLQRKKAENDTWENVADQNVTLSENNKWEYQFDVDAYYNFFEIADESEPLKAWKYRVVEVDGNGIPIEDSGELIANGNLYKVGYSYDNDKDAWVIKNTRLLDLTISKIVDGKYGDRGKEFTFTIQVDDGDGNPLNGDYSYIGSIKQGYEQQSVQPQDGTITFRDGKGQIKLTHGQQITIKNLPVNAKIIVTEQAADGYTIKYTINGENKNHGELTLTQHSVVDVTNVKGDIPDTGITNSVNGIVLGFGLASIGVLSFAVLYLLRLRKER